MEQRRRVLLIDDDPNLLEVVGTALERAGFVVLTARNGIEGDKMFRTHPVHLVILDVMMPQRDGLLLCRDIRAISSVPIMMLTARTEMDDVVQGLELGADDYITKPFDLREVVARVKAVLARIDRQREGEPESRVRTIGEISLNLDRGMVVTRGKQIALTPIELALLNYLMTNCGRLLDRDTLLRDVWGYDYTGRTNLVDVAMRRLREKIEADPSNPVYLQTVRGQGYRFAAPT